MYYWHILSFAKLQENLDCEFSVFINNYIIHLRDFEKYVLKRHKIQYFTQRNYKIMQENNRSIILTIEIFSGYAEQRANAEEEVQGEADEEEFGEGGPPMDPLR